jgi:hypothetical protein
VAPAQGTVMLDHRKEIVRVAARMAVGGVAQLHVRRQVQAGERVVDVDVNLVAVHARVAEPLEVHNHQRRQAPQRQRLSRDLVLAALGAVPACE